MVISEEKMKLPSTKKAELLSWAQLKKLTQLAEKSLKNTRVTQTPENMLLAALMIVSMVVSLPMSAGAAAANYTYWAYVPFPPSIQAATWMDNSIEVYVNNTAWVPGPTDDGGLAQPEEEGMMTNISIGYHYLPICLGKAPDCLMPATQNWLVEVPTVSAISRFTYHMVSGMSLRPQINNLQDPSYQRSLQCRPKGKPGPKEIPKESKSPEVLVWEECVADTAVVLQNNEFGTIIDWAPRGQLYHNCMGQTQSCSQVPSIWPINLAYDRDLTESLDQVHRRLESLYPWKWCVKPPYMLFVGIIDLKPDSQTITCENCRLFTFIDSTLDWQHRILLVRAREGMGIPVSMYRLWEASSSIYILTEVLKGVLTRSKRFIFTLIAVIIGLIAVTATAVTAGIALHSSVQTAEYVNNWQKNSSKLWNSQTQIDKKLANQINHLRQTVIWMGDRLMSSEYLFQLQCDWNTPDFSMTSRAYNESEHHWDMVRCHLQGREDNLTLDISKLKEQIFEASKAQLNLVPETEAMVKAVDSLTNLNPATWVKAIGSSTIANFILILVCLSSLLLVYRCTQQLRRDSDQRERTMMTMAVLSKRKGGYVGKGKRPLPIPSFHPNGADGDSKHFSFLYIKISPQKQAQILPYVLARYDDEQCNGDLIDGPSFGLDSCVRMTQHRATSHLTHDEMLLNGPYNSLQGWKTLMMMVSELTAASRHVCSAAMWLIARSLLNKIFYNIA
ncbi:LOW QUALITY PROTEIN: endogenous retrovirus group K member 113 Env polyprotein-like [Symphalangus syndactylus]|uniref:LOW QUALITY PROTEIN: endogenous retrovirus group K member 113 Env polyprotein-like n=1 Tax=Symphalangus syndactylus TaxID=9590 RepID=UPI003007A89C